MGGSIANSLNSSIKNTLPTTPKDQLNRKTSNTSGIQTSQAKPPKVPPHSWEQDISYKFAPFEDDEHIYDIPFQGTGSGTGAAGQTPRKGRTYSSASTVIMDEPKAGAAQTGTRSRSNSAAGKNPFEGFDYNRYDEAKSTASQTPKRSRSNSVSSNSSKNEQAETAPASKRRGIRARIASAPKRLKTYLRKKRTLRKVRSQVYKSAKQPIKLEKNEKLAKDKQLYKSLMQENKKLPILRRLVSATKATTKKYTANRKMNDAYKKDKRLLKKTIKLRYDVNKAVKKKIAKK